MINEATLRYVLQHAYDDIRMLALRGCKDPQVDLTLALQQIQGRQTARRKLPTWAAIDGIVYPPHLNMEQCSSELTARYKREVAENLIVSGRRKFLDLTGGFGVDFSFMADVFDEAVYVERDPYLCELAAQNFTLLGKRNVSIICADATDYLKSVASVEETPFTLIFVDPARRDSHGARTYALADCTPDVTTMMDELLRRSCHVLLKLSPMLDWRKAVADLAPHHVQEVHIVAVDNECKELLLLLTRETSDTQQTEPCLICTDIHSRDGSRTVYRPSPSCPVDCDIVAVSSAQYLYEPNAAVMKAGCFRELAADFNTAQLAPNSHLFTSSAPVKDFPGRSFHITAIATMNKRDLRSTLGHLKTANISVRNFPLSAEKLRQRLKLADGGTDYIFATTLSNGDHIIMLCTKL
ncbi:MAG: SAM-dependent methyltransferase [Prevotella sp.]|nr:SAM-dependent methyltransferase [Prevotella sp.]